MDKKSKPLLVDQAKTKIISMAQRKKCLSHKIAVNELVLKVSAKRYSRSTFDAAWRYLRDNNIIISIPKNDPDRKECEMKAVNEKEFYRLNNEKAPSLYSSLKDNINKIDTPDKAFAFIGQLSAAYEKLDEIAYYEDLVAKILDRSKKIEFKDKNECMAFHYILLESIINVHDRSHNGYDSVFLQKLHDEIDFFSPLIDGGACNIVSALGITAYAFTIIWESDRNMGRNEFSTLLNATIKSMNELKTLDDLISAKRNFTMLQCYENNAIEYDEYFSEVERKDFSKRMQNSYFSASLPGDFNLKTLINSTIYWLISHS